jgi:hypothetical protein
MLMANRPLSINIVRRTHSQFVIQFPASKYRGFVQSVAEGGCIVAD